MLSIQIFIITSHDCYIITSFFFLVKITYPIMIKKVVISIKIPCIKLYNMNDLCTEVINKPFTKKKVINKPFWTLMLLTNGDSTLFIIKGGFAP